MERKVEKHSRKGATIIKQIQSEDLESPVIVCCVSSFINSFYYMALIPFKLERAIPGSSKFFLKFNQKQRVQLIYAANIHIFRIDF